jgi:hypothetical protein
MLLKKSAARAECATIESRRPSLRINVAASVTFLTSRARGVHPGVQSRACARGRGLPVSLINHPRSDRLVPWTHQGAPHRTPAGRREILGPPANCDIARARESGVGCKAIGFLASFRESRAIRRLFRASAGVHRGRKRAPLNGWRALGGNSTPNKKAVIGIAGRPFEFLNSDDNRCPRWSL